MSQAEEVTKFWIKETARAKAFADIWENQINAVFVDVATYYDKVNQVASLGLINWFRNSFISMIELQPQYRVLDVCAGTNAVGIALLKKHPDLQVFAVDRSAEMQGVGQENARQLGLHIDSTITDVHRLPYPDNHFDVVTLSFASRHLKLITVIDEIRRVLKPGGHFYHNDMLRPGNRFVEKAYLGYLNACVSFVAWKFNSDKHAKGCKNYFVEAIRLFYSPEELTQLLYEQGFVSVSSKPLLGGVVCAHKAVKSQD